MLRSDCVKGANQRSRKICFPGGFRRWTRRWRFRFLCFIQDHRVLDEDLGISGTGKAERPGFRRLLNLVTEQQVGLVLGLEMSRLARNSRDWDDLFGVCAIFGTLIANTWVIYADEKEFRRF